MIIRFFTEDLAESVLDTAVRRAVDHEDWDLVKQLADHNLYDDQRAWLLTKARKQEKWDVAVQLADLGLRDVQMDRVHCFVAKHADWDTHIPDTMGDRDSRKTRAEQLPLTSELKRYVLFEDLVNPENWQNEEISILRIYR
nr:hypothetical protein BaRGS_011084 [Batillaria attramentaria]